MKTKMFLLLVATAGLSGCAVYPVPAYDGYGYADPGPTYVTPPVVIYGSGVYRHSSPSYGPAYQRGYRHHPGQGPRDRDGDGVRNRHDRDPNNPYRR